MRPSWKTIAKFWAEQMVTSCCGAYFDCLLYISLLLGAVQSVAFDLSLNPCVLWVLSE